MLKKRIIPSLLLKDGRVVKSIRFGNCRDTGHPNTAARVYDAQRVDELMVLDITASREKRKILFEIVATMAEECFMPLCIGGGIRSIEDMQTLLRNGADKVVINTAAVEVEGLIAEAAQKFGSSTIVVSIDVKTKEDGTYNVWTHSGTVDTGFNPIEWAKEVAARGAGEIFLTSIDRDGTMEGLDIPLIQSVVNAVPTPVIAAGGVGSLEDMLSGLEIAGAAAVSAASIFHFTDQSPIKARKYLVGRGAHVRP